MIGIPLLFIYLAFLGVEHTVLKKRAVQNMKKFMESVSRAYAAEFNGELAKISQIADVTASFMDTNPVIIENQIYDFLKANIQLESLVYGSAVAFEPGTAPYGKQLSSPYVWKDRKTQSIQRIDIGQDAYNYQDWDWYKLPKQQNHPVWTEPYFDEGAGNVIMTTYSAPFYRDGKFWGVATADIDLQDLQQRIQEHLPLAGSIILISQAGRFIVHPDTQMIMHETIFSLAEKRNQPELAKLGEKMIAGEQGIELVHNFAGHDAVFIIYGPVNETRWSIAAFVREDEVMAPVWKQIGRFSMLMTGTIALILLIVFIAAYRMTIPLRKLTAAVQQLSKGNLDTQIPGHYEKDEIGELASGFNKMVKDLKNYIQALTRETVARQMVESELDIARRIQTSLLPSSFPPFPNRNEFDLYALNKPARHVAGDFFDFFLADDNTLVFVIADVSGKGIPAAMFMAMTRTILRNLATDHASPGKVLERANEVLAQDNQNGMFVTLFLGYYEIASGKLRYANAGHLLPFKITGRGKVESCAAVTGTVLGCLEKQTFGEKEEILQKGETVVFYTDGVTEARNSKEEFLGEEKFKELLVKFSDELVGRLCEDVFKFVDDFQSHELRDDLTLLALKRR